MAETTLSTHSIIRHPTTHFPRKPSFIIPQHSPFTLRCSRWSCRGRRTPCSSARASPPPSPHPHYPHLLPTHTAHAHYPHTLHAHTTTLTHYARRLEARRVVLAARACALELKPNNPQSKTNPTPSLPRRRTSGRAWRKTSPPHSAPSSRSCRCAARTPPHHVPPPPPPLHHPSAPAQPPKTTSTDYTHRCRRAPRSQAAPAPASARTLRLHSAAAGARHLADDGARPAAHPGLAGPPGRARSQGLREELAL